MPEWYSGQYPFKKKIGTTEYSCVDFLFGFPVPAGLAADYPGSRLYSGPSLVDSGKEPAEYGVCEIDYSCGGVRTLPERQRKDKKGAKFFFTTKAQRH